jgi:diketogulonate reductase-like aldo/keto reductase
LTHPFCQQQGSAEFLAANGVQIESWGPFAEGRNNLFSNELLASIGENHHKSVAQVVLRWLIQRGVIAIPKSTKPERIAQNFDIFDFSLSESEMDAIKGLDQGKSLFFDHQDPAMVKFLSERRID